MIHHVPPRLDRSAFARIADQLSRTVIGDIAAATRLMDFDMAIVERLRRREIVAKSGKEADARF